MKHYTLKSLLLILCLLANFKAISQIDTKIVLSENTGRLVVRDLVKYDILKLKYKYQDSIIRVQKSEIATLKSINDINDEIIGKQDKIITKYSAKYKFNCYVGSVIYQNIDLYAKLGLSYSNYHINILYNYNNLNRYIAINLEYKLL